MTVARLHLDAYRERLTHLSQLAADGDVGAVVVAPSPDMVYLIGYDPMPLPNAPRC